MKQVYSSNKDFRYPRVQFLINGWYNENWWEGSAEEQEDLERKFGCTTEQRKSLVQYILGVSTTAKDVENYTKISDNGYVSAVISLFVFPLALISIYVKFLSIFLFI